MQLLNISKLEKFRKRHADTKKHLDNWRRIIETAPPNTPDELRELFPLITLLGHGQVIFKIKGDHYRLIAKFYFQDRIVQICWVGTHPQYDRIDAMAVCDD